MHLLDDGYEVMAVQQLPGHGVVSTRRLVPLFRTEADTYGGSNATVMTP